jgi:hypothetical protein
MIERLPNFYPHQYPNRDGPPDFMLLPARHSLPLYRGPLGLDMVNPKRAGLQTVALIVLPEVYWQFYATFTGHYPFFELGHEYLVAYALLIFFLHVAIFVRRIIGQRHGEDVHSTEVGYSWLAWVTPLPSYITEIVIVPACVGGIGWYIAHSYSFELGYWLVATAASLFLLAVYEEQRRFNAIRSTKDALLAAQYSGWRVAQQEVKGRKRFSGKDSPDVADFG